jgi:hypothetical protein
VKILYLATRGEGRTPLSIEREVDMLTRTFADTLVEFRALPWARAESLVRDLSTQQFDVLHITAHGEGEALQVLDEKGATVMMSAEQILAFLPQMQKPRLVYLNACDSGPLAKQLAAQVPFAIGSTLPLGNDQAIHAALSFYWRVLLGGTIEEAFQAARGMVGLLSDERPRSRFTSSAKGRPRRFVCCRSRGSWPPFPVAFPKAKKSSSRSHSGSKVHRPRHHRSSFLPTTRLLSMRAAESQLPQSCALLHVAAQTRTAHSGVIGLNLGMFPETSGFLRSA